MARLRPPPSPTLLTPAHPAPFPTFPTGPARGVPARPRPKRRCGREYAAPVGDSERGVVVNDSERPSESAGYPSRLSESADGAADPRLVTAACGAGPVG